MNEIILVEVADTLKRIAAALEAQNEILKQRQEFLDRLIAEVGKRLPEVSA